MSPTIGTMVRVMNAQSMRRATCTVPLSLSLSLELSLSNERTNERTDGRWDEV